MSASPPLDLQAIEARLMQKIRHRSDKVLTIGCDTARDIEALLAHARALRAVLRLGRDLLMEHDEHLGAAKEVFNDWDEQARAVLAAAQDGPA